MWILPVPVGTQHGHPVDSWSEMASNIHFALYMKTRISWTEGVSNFIQNLNPFSPGNDRSKRRSSGLTTSLIAPGPEMTKPLTKAVGDYKFHIVLKCVVRREEYIISASDDLKDIHENWNWIERQLFPKLLEMTNTQERVPEGEEIAATVEWDDFLLSQFDITMGEAGSVQSDFHSLSNPI